MNAKDIYDAVKADTRRGTFVTAVFKIVSLFVLPALVYVLVDGTVSIFIRHMWYPYVPTADIAKAYTSKIIFELPILLLYVWTVSKVRKYFRVWSTNISLWWNRDKTEHDHEVLSFWEIEAAASQRRLAELKGTLATPKDAPKPPTEDGIT